MLRVSIENVEPGMINAQAIYNPNGKILLGRGVKLSEHYIDRLQKMGIASLYIVDDIVDEVVIPDVIGEELRQETVNKMRQVFKGISLQRRLNTKDLQGLTADILDEILKNPGVLAQMVDIRNFDDYTFYHSVNVCILSLMIGRTMSMNTAQLRDLGVGALMHDIGRIKLPKAILDKPGRLTWEEFEEVQKHTSYGFEILRQYFELSLLSSHVAFQHHERFDGSGYPRGLKGSEIHEFSRIVAVVDVYDAMLAKRAYRPAYSLFNTLEEIKQGIGKQFDSDVVYALFKNVAIYPVGSLVELSTGDIAVIVHTDQDTQYQPVIRRLVDRYGKKIEREQEINLREFSRIKIVKLHEDDSLYIKVREIFMGKN